jgi:hypothetical protein
MKKEKKKCELCEREFEFNPKLKRDREKRFCSSYCAKSFNGRNNKGKKRTKEQRMRISENNKGVNNPFFGKSHSKESKSKMSKSKQWDESKFRYCNLNCEEKEILDGLLLSDGCLSEKSRISARLTFGFKFKETSEEIFKALKSIDFGPIWKSEYTNCYHSKSNMYHDLLSENNRWYPNKEKIVPKDILITPKSCYWWFIGDGYTSGGNVYLCTDSFTENDNKFLIDRLKEKGFNPSLTSRNRIRFNKKETTSFLEWIKPKEGIMEQYKYKWEI